jgi:hypothetical protein
MKTTRMAMKTRMGKVNKRPGRSKARFDHANMPLFVEQAPQSLIQWPTDQQIGEVSRRLAMISQRGIRWEAHGDYFNSGDLA